MGLNEEIEDLIERAKDIIPERARNNRIELYTEGLRVKIKQTEFALLRLQKYNNRSDEKEESTEPKEYEIIDKVHFYCDSFWTCLYSSLDILAQIINQALKLNLNEENVTFKNIKEILGSRFSGQYIEKKYLACYKSRPFSNLYKYRNCSTHRRQIYIEETMASLKIKGTKGYPQSSTGDIEVVKRVICDDPLDLIPKIKQKRDIPTYLEETKDKILNHIENIIKRTEPIG